MRSGCRGGAVITAGLLLAACAQLPRPVSENSTLPSAAFPDPPHRLVQEGESPVIGGLGRAQVADGQTLVDLARRFDLGFDEMQQANPDLDMWVPPSQAQVVLSNRHLLPRAPRTGIVINLAARRLFWFEGEGVRTHPIGIGRSGWETPLARTRVTAKAQDPPWRVPASVRREHAQAALQLRQRLRGRGQLRERLRRQRRLAQLRVRPPRRTWVLCFVSFSFETH